jgi:hypothetical protein
MRGAYWAPWAGLGGERHQLLLEDALDLVRVRLGVLQLLFQLALRRLPRSAQRRLVLGLRRRHAPHRRLRRVALALGRHVRFELLERIRRSLHKASFVRRGVDVGGGWAQSPRRCKRSEPSPGTDVAGVSPARVSCFAAATSALAIAPGSACSAASASCACAWCDAGR